MVENPEPDPIAAASDVAVQEPPTEVSAEPVVPARPGNGLRVLTAGLLALVLLVGVGGAVVVMRFVSSGAFATLTAPGPVAVVRSYLEAVAAGDADKAKAFAVVPPKDGPTLTGDFLRAAVAKNPLTHIVVGEVQEPGTAPYVDATYLVGSTEVSGRFTLSRVDRRWKLNDVVATASRPQAWGSLHTQVNGTEISTFEDIRLFPGSYVLTSGTSLLAFENPTIIISSPGKYQAKVTVFAPRLTDAGKTATIAAAQDFLKACLLVQSLAPRGCGMGTYMPAGVSWAPGSIVRYVDMSRSAPFVNAIPRVRSDSPQTVEFTTHLEVLNTARDTSGGHWTVTTTINGVVGLIDGEKITIQEMY